MLQRGRLQPAGLYRGVGHQNPAPLKDNKTIGASQPEKRTTTAIHGGGYQKSTGVRSHQKQPVVQPTVRPSSWLPGGTYRKPVTFKTQKPPKPAIAKPVVRPRPSIQQGGYPKKVVGQSQHLICNLGSLKAPFPFQKIEPENILSIQNAFANQKNHEHHEQNRVKPASSSGKVKFTEFKTSEIDAAVSKPAMRLHETKDYSVYKSKFGAIMLPKEGASPSMEEFTRALEIFRSIQHKNLANLVGACSPRRALVYELLPDTLEDRLTDIKLKKSFTFRGKKSFTWRDRVTTAASICSALDYLHRNNHKPIIHGDLKPRNVHFTADNICKLRNFGISTLLHPTKHVSSAIEEVIQGIFQTLMDTDGCKIQIQTDVSALGIILLQLVTGHSDAKGLRDFVAQKLGDDSEFQRKSILQKREILKGIVDPELKRCQTPVEGAARMLFLGLRFSDPAGKQCPPSASEVLPQIQSMHSSTYSQMVWVHHSFF
uniref:RING-type E3 ubiquitin transferase n=1 Tax=Oryza barthii TaxID=65489 RepID=A0A0D3FE36_9ORYZ